MKILVVLLGSLICLVFVNTLPMKDEKTLRNLKASLEYGPAFDEIIVNSSLNVRNKNKTRIARAQPTHHNMFNNFPPFPNFGGGAAAGSAQSQAFNAFGPTTNFGASATGAQTQAFNFGPKGITGTAGISGTQQYNLPNGGSFNVDFSEAFSAASQAASKSTANGNAVSLTYKGPDGKIMPIKG
ncbi:unnamed protein product [Brassicogethes aeneus]|uniref:Uncharacterized protein n=1 Tax=Brassicogethes aeneus TaxID=1431903 RepID=A0A9P0BK60_BRAAE|nr:unnamed protein product [Brassicogethes aeneus]